MAKEKAAAIIGGGVIGGGWAARFALSGWDVAVFDPNPSARQAVMHTIDRARRSYPALYDRLLPPEGSLEFAPDLAGAVADVSWIQESIPEQLDLKRKTYGQIQEHCATGTIISSSTSGFKPSDLQAGARRPGEIMVAHPFNPVYLLPVVELVQSDANSPDLVSAAQSVLESIGMFPLKVRTEIDAHLADRFLEAIWREALWLIKDDVATTGEIDDVIRMGFGLRWAQMGLFETYRIAGGPQGMEHFIHQFGPCLELPWTRLTDVPRMDRELAGKIGRQSDQQSGLHSIEQLEQIRDDNLVTIMRGLKARNWGAGRFLREFEEKNPVTPAVNPLDCPVTTIERVIPMDWTDYNGHLNEARYLEIFSLATDSFLAAIGCDQNYVAGGMSYFTLETNIRHLQEAFAGERVRVETYCPHGSGKKLHLCHRLSNGKGDNLATGEHLLVHIDLAIRKSSEPSAAVAKTLHRVAAAHANSRPPRWRQPKLSFGKHGEKS